MLKRSRTVSTTMLLATAGLAFCIAGCSAVGDAFREDFIDPAAFDRRGSIPAGIEALRDSVPGARGSALAGLHRRLAVAYRMEGTPSSRVRSIEEIDAALKISPHDPILHVEKGLTRCAQRFLGDAVSCLRTAIELDPGCFDAWYHLGMIRRDDYLRTLCFPAALREAADCFRRANAIDGTHEDALLNLTLLSMLEGRSDETSRCLLAGRRLYPDSRDFPLIEAVALLQSERFDEAAAVFELALSRMCRIERELYEDISPLLRGDEARRYLNLDPRNRSEYGRRFWAANDPTPATDLNERLLEHYRRIVLARRLLDVPRSGIDGPRTARGLALISYGLPERIEYDLGQGTDGPFVVWGYRIGDRLVRLHFQDEFLSGNYQIPIAPKFSIHADATAGILRSVPQMYRYPVPFEDLPVALQWAQTRGADGATRLEFSLALRAAAALERNGRCRIDLAIFDADWNRFLTESFSILADTLPVIERSGERWAVATFAVDAFPRELECTAAVEIRGGTPPSRAVRAEPVLMRRFHGRFLSLSSVRLTLPDARATRAGVLDPLPVYRRGTPLRVAYEIFDLRLDRSLTARYRLTYRITRNTPEHEGFRKTLFYIVSTARGGPPDREPFITSSFERSAGDTSIRDLLWIDTAELRTGGYLLTLEIQDRVSGKLVSDAREFCVTE